MSGLHLRNRSCNRIIINAIYVFRDLLRIKNLRSSSFPRWQHNHDLTVVIKPLPPTCRMALYTSHQPRGVCEVYGGHTCHCGKSHQVGSARARFNVQTRCAVAQQHQCIRGNQSTRGIQAEGDDIFGKVRSTGFTIACPHEYRPEEGVLWLANYFEVLLAKFAGVGAGFFEPAFEAG